MNHGAGSRRSVHPLSSLHSGSGEEAEGGRTSQREGAAGRSNQYRHDPRTGFSPSSLFITSILNRLNSERTTPVSAFADCPVVRARTTPSDLTRTIQALSPPLELAAGRISFDRQLRQGSAKCGHSVGAGRLARSASRPAPLAVCAAGVLGPRVGPRRAQCEGSAQVRAKKRRRKQRRAHMPRRRRCALDEFSCLDQMLPLLARTPRAPAHLHLLYAPLRAGQVERKACHGARSSACGPRPHGAGGGGGIGLGTHPAGLQEATAHAAASRSAVGPRSSSGAN